MKERATRLSRPLVRRLCGGAVGSRRSVSGNGGVLGTFLNWTRNGRLSPNRAHGAIDIPARPNFRRTGVASASLRARLSARRPALLQFESLEIKRPRLGDGAVPAAEEQPQEA